MKTTEQQLIDAIQKLQCIALSLRAERQGFNSIDDPGFLEILEREAV